MSDINATVDLFGNDAVIGRVDFHNTVSVDFAEYGEAVAYFDRHDGRLVLATVQTPIGERTATDMIELTSLVNMVNAARNMTAAESWAKVTGSVSATVINERRNEDGTLTTVSTESFAR